MITFNTQKTLKDLRGNELKENDKSIKIGDVICDHLSMNRENQARSYQLAKKFATDEKVELKAEDVVFIKESLGKLGLTALVLGQIEEELEGSSK